MNIYMALSIVAAALTALLLTPLVSRFAFYVGAVDQPGERKVHRTPMPRLGGLAIFSGLLVGLLLFWLSGSEALSGLWIMQQRGIIFFLALLVMIGLGVWDDIKALGPGRKFLIQLLVSSALYAAGFHISFITNPFTGGAFHLAFFDYALTMVWIIGITNAINLSDGLDGLASGISTIACLTIAPIAILRGDIGTALLALVLAGSILGFLWHNFNPARIFLGDSGSLGLGFSLAVLSVESSTKASAIFAIAVPIIALGLPIMDTVLSMSRRLLRSFIPEESSQGSMGSRLRKMFHPDRSHIHHRLIARGLSHRTAVLVLYSVSCFLGIGALAITLLNGVGASLILLAVGIAAVIGIRQLHYTEMAVLKNGVLLPLYDNDVVNRDTFRSFLDLGFIVGSYSLASFLTDWHQLAALGSQKVIETVALVSSMQFIVLWTTGLYKGTVRLMGVRDALRVTRSVGLATAASWILLKIVVVPSAEASLTRMVLDFYFLLTLVLGSRASFSILKHLSNQRGNGHRRALLYGAGSNGAIVLEKILQGELKGLTPIGFLDEDPYLEGKSVQGYPVFGGHWKLARVLKTMKVDEIFIVNENLPFEVLRRLEKASRLNGVPLRRLSIALEPVDILSDGRKVLQA